MKLISPNFLQKINTENFRETILTSLFIDEDIVSIVMKKNKMNFEQACEYISMLIYDKQAPEASESEKAIMKTAAKEFFEEWKNINEEK